MRSFVALALGVGIATALYVHWTNKRLLELRRRVHELEMERLPGFRG